MSTEKYSYTDLANATNIYTGGISTGTASHPDIKDRNNFVFKVEVKLKVLEKNLDKALELMEQMLLTSDFTDTKRLGELVAQIKARLQANLSSSGHLVAAMRSMSSFRATRFIRTSKGSCFLPLYMPHRKGAFRVTKECVR